MIKYHFDNIIVVRKIPSVNKDYSRKWIVKRLFELFKTHQVCIIDPQKDITFLPDEEDPENFHTIVIIFDGFSHMRANDQLMDPLDDDDPNRIELLYSQSDDEGEGNDKLEEEKSKKAEAKKKAENPDEYSCAMCTMLNHISLSTCDCCGSERPPMAQIVEASIAAYEESCGGAGGDGANGEAKLERTPLHKTRLEMLTRDIRHMISHDQRLIILKKALEEKARKDKEEAERK